MRKDVILGMTIGGGLLAVIIGYNILNPNAKKDKHPVDTGGASLADGSGNPGDSTTSPGDGNEAKPGQTNGGGNGADATLLMGHGPDANDIWGKRLNGDMAVTRTPDTNTQTARADTLVDPSNPGEGARKNEFPVDPNGATHTPAAPATGKQRVHRVQKGETFSTIAAAAYGSPTLYHAIVKANPNVNPSKLRPGTEIILPDLASANADKAATSGPTALKTEAAVDGKTEYRVQAGDSLNKISMKVYGRVGMVDKIYDLNKALIGANPAKLKLGMVLKLPQNAPVATTN